MSEDARALLAVIAGRDKSGLIEVRCRRPSDGRIVARDWFPVDKPDACLRFIASNAERFDVYVGVAPRSKREGGKAAIPRSWLLYVDCDSAESVQRLRGFTPAPSLVVRSGTGSNVHAYWALSHPLSCGWFERANRRLSYRLGADLKVTDAARILRPPGTLNHKHDPAGRVTLTFVDQSRCWSVAEIVGGLPDPPMDRPLPRRRPRANVQANDPLEGVSADRYYTTLTGREIQRGNQTCPFHSGGKERTPSFRLYDVTWYCFTCCKGGSVYEFAAELWGLGTRGADFLELRQRLTRELQCG